MRNEKVYYGIRILAGGYVAYMGYKLISGLIQGQEGSHAVMGIFGALFIAAGIFIAITGIRGLSRAGGGAEEESRETSAEVPAEPEPPAEEENAAEEPAEDPRKNE